MAAPTYQVNGGAEIPGVVSNWQRVPKRTNSDGTITYSSWAINTWQIPVITDTLFQTLLALKGASLTSLDTNLFSNRNNGITYFQAILENAVQGRQQGLMMFDVTVQFRVNTTGLRPQITEAVAASESVTLFTDILHSSVSDSVTVAESVTVSVV